MPSELPLFDSIKKQELNRMITFILTSNGSKESKETKAKISFKIQDININVLKKLENIAKLYNATPSRINLALSKPPFPIFNGNIEDIFDIVTDSEFLRIIVKFEDYNTQDLNKIIDDKKISHIVEINVLEEKSNQITKDNHNDENITCATIYPKSIDGIYKVIEDVILDIAMYHTVISPNLLQTDLEIKRSISFLKLSYAKKLKLKSENWNSKGYISLAGYFRTKKNNYFDFGAYVKCWDEIYMEAKSLYPADFVIKKNSINDQLKRHRLYKQLPIKKIISIYNHLEEGRYLLICTTVRPQQKHKRREILVYFKGINWRKTKINIVDFSKFEEIVKYSEWVSIFKIIK